MPERISSPAPDADDVEESLKLIHGGVARQASGSATSSGSVLDETPREDLWDFVSGIAGSAEAVLSKFVDAGN